MSSSNVNSYRSYVVILNGGIVFETNDLSTAIGYRLGSQKGAVFGRLLPEFEPLPASPVLPRDKRRSKKP